MSMPLPARSQPDGQSATAAAGPGKRASPGVTSLMTHPHHWHAMRRNDYSE